MSQPSLHRLSRTASIVGGLLWACLAPVFVYAETGLDKPATAAFALAATSMWLVGVVSLLLLLLGLAQLWWLGRDRLGRWGQVGVLVSALALGAMALGNGVELYTVTTRGTESDVGHTIFLSAFLVLIVASVLLGQVFVRRRWSAGVRWAGLFLLLVSPLGILFLVLGGALSPDTDLGFWSALTVPYALARVAAGRVHPKGQHAFNAGWRSGCRLDRLKFNHPAAVGPHRIERQCPPVTRRARTEADAPTYSLVRAWLGVTHGARCSHSAAGWPNNDRHPTNKRLEPSEI